MNLFNASQEQNIKETEFTNLPKDWDVLKIGDILEEVKLVLDESDFDEKDVPILSLSKNLGLIPQKERFNHRVATKNVKKYKIVKKGQIVYNPYVIWEGAINSLKHFEAGLVSPAYVVWQTKESCNWKYLDYLLRTEYMLNQYNKYSSGAVVRRRAIKKTLFKQIKIALPPPDEQQKIISVLSKIEEAQKKSSHVVRVLRDLKKATMKHLFTYGTTKFQVRFSTPTKQSEIGNIPESWSIKKIGDLIIRSQYGLSKRAEKNGKYPMLRMNNLSNGLIKTKDLKYLDLEEEEFQKFKLIPGDVLFNRTNSFELVGKTSLFTLEGNYTFASYIIRLQVNKSELLPDFLNYYLNWEKTQFRLKALATRAIGQSNISASRLKSFKIPVPKIDEQEFISSTLSTIDRQIESENNKKQKLNNLFNSMRSRLINADIRLKKWGI